MKEAVVYVLWDGQRSYYVGCSRNYQYRLRQHLCGEGSKTTKRWLRTGKKVLEYWKIRVNAEVNESGECDATKLSLTTLESLVLKTLRRQNPYCCISM